MPLRASIFIVTIADNRCTPKPSVFCFHASGARPRAGQGYICYLGDEGDQERDGGHHGHPHSGGGHREQPQSGGGHREQLQGWNLRL